MKVCGSPRPPLRWCLTLSGKRVHGTIPTQHHTLTVCREVVYQLVGTHEVLGRTICARCLERLPSHVARGGER